MQVRKLVSLFFLKLLVIYLLLVAAWAGTPLSHLYANQFRSIGTWFFGAFTFGVHGRIRLETMDAPTDLWDTNLTFRHEKTNTQGSLPFGTQYWGFAPTSMVASLILAGPFPWRRRARALIWGILLVHVWIGLEILLAAINSFSMPSPLAVYHPPQLVARFLSFITEVVTKSTAARYAISTVIWGAVTFRRPEREFLQSALSRNRLEPRA